MADRLGDVMMPTGPIRPGPTSVDPGRVPGGLLIHVYSVPDERLLFERYFTDPFLAAVVAESDAEVAGLLAGPEAEGVCLVVFDGDSGRRYTAEEIHRALGWAR